MGIVVTLGPPDEQLALRAAGGDRGAFETLVRRHTRALLAFCRRFMADDAEAEDRVQEAFLKAYQNIDRYRPGARFSSWLYKIANNTCIDALRAKKDWAPLPEQGPAEGAAKPLDFDQVEQLDEAVAGLNAKYRAVLHCKYALGMNATEIASHLDMTPANVRVCLHRAIRTLRTRIK